MENLQDVINYFKHKLSKPLGDGRRKAYTAAVEAMERLAAYENGAAQMNVGSKWIPCSECLPDESDYYMACIYDDEVGGYDFRKTWFAHVDDYDMDEPEWRELYDFERVTAWQPLPEPYNGGE